MNDPDGSLSDEDDWLDTLDDGGQLSSILDFGLAAGGRPLTWLVDPAVPDSAGRIADGNPARELVEPDEGGIGEGAEEEPPRPTAPGSAAPQEPAPAERGRRRREVAGQAQPGGDRQAGPRPALG